MLPSLKSTLRSLKRAPLYSVVAVLILGLGIGVSTAAFSLTNAAIFRGLPLPESEQLVAIFRTDPESNARHHSPATFIELRQTASSFSGLAAWFIDSITVVVPGALPERVDRLIASANFLSTIRLQPYLGRDFAPDEDQPGRSNVVMLTYHYWQERFAGDPNVIGRQIRVSSEALTVIGILPPLFDSLPNWQRLSVVSPFTLWPTFTSARKSKWLGIAGRLKPGITLQTANAEVAAFAVRIAKEYPADNAGQSIRVVPLASSSVSDGTRKVYWLVTSLALLVLVIASANLAGVQLARAFGRSREFAIRYALGAKPLALMKPVCAESLILSFIGCGLGLVIARWANLTITYFQPIVAPVLWDPRVLVFASMVTALAGLVVGLVPAWAATRGPVNDALKEMSHSSTSGKTQKTFRNLLVGTQLALAFVLVSAGLTLVIALRATLSRAVGWEGKDIVVGEVSLTASQYFETAKQLGFVRDLRTQLTQIPGIDRVSIDTWTPIFDYFDHEKLFVDGRAPSPPGQEAVVLRNSVDDEFFSILNIRLKEGQMFSRNITPETPSIAIVNETLARRYWPAESAIGKHIRFSETSPWAEIIGVVGDVRMAAKFSSPASRMQAYVPLQQNPRTHCSFLVHSSLPVGALENQIRLAVARINQDVTVIRLGSVDQFLRQAIATYDFLVFMIAVFAGVGLLIAIIGLYGVMAQFAIRSKREICVRIALGATRYQILAFTVSRVARVIVAGLIAGSVGLFFVRSYYQRLLPELPLPDARWQCGIFLALGVVGFLAVLFPALRASRTDPAIVLRSE